MNFDNLHLGTITAKSSERILRDIVDHRMFLSIQDQKIIQYQQHHLRYRHWLIVAGFLGMDVQRADELWSAHY